MNFKGICLKQDFMKTYGNHPTKQCVHQNGDVFLLSEFSNPKDDPNNYYALGLTKREHFAAMAMQGMLHRGGMTEHGVISQAPDTIAMLAVNQADALIEALNK